MKVGVLLLSLVLLATGSKTFAQDVKKSKKPKYKHKIVKIPIVTNNATDLLSLPIFFKKADLEIPKDHKMFKVTKKRNPQVKNWDAIPAGTKIKLYMSSKYIDPNKYAQYNSMLKQLEIKKAKKLKKQKSKIVKVKMMAGAKEDIASLYESIKIKYAIIPEDGKEYKLTKKKNKSVDDWSKIEPYEDIYVYIYKKNIDRKKLKKYRKALRKRAKKYKNSLFLVTSFGNLTETFSTLDTDLDQSQNSPLTVGVSTNRKIRKNLTYSGSAYFSIIDKASYNGNETTIPPEYGFTSYAEYQNKGWPASIYTGVDFETLSSYNVSDIATTEKLKINSNSLLYFTLGTSKVFKLKNRWILFKASVSQSLYSSVSSDADVDPFTGQKFIIFGATPITKRLSGSLFFKRHMFSGDSELIIQRIGIGVGWGF